MMPFDAFSRYHLVGKDLVVVDVVVLNFGFCLNGIELTGL